ncbi:PD-(D/E)XK nuclease superfamily protein [Halobacillus karajensis]|uniref:PD-(D/E)XK nuclease superfamily protein n=1 Tax=Halobacillus karajensis TaxID=195088 RepID=A0A024P4E0_9BACI|nr:PD-(D/E)XK nuclease family protein [Halobacillus karajensis]CDQ18665.1 PD-(D/E)XK nuclease superfamily protein [Halobacillus karajensis]CDQ23263.1 PD-(D/E)XK nuclease superfamily protein [Halobacillus karajensis]CDQ26745.1 PD-(D/E)XK nuclease superfamily protein [Halobacillus karajensis]SEH48427.1 PD-(D/E)XK nuclease superfamily protein [Halobacillus karajensis]
MFEVKPYPELSWSLSRHKTMLSCLRKYAYDYYISHNGWLRSADTLSKQAYRLKKITNLEMHFGSVVHDLIYQTIQRVIRNQTILTEEAFIDEVRHHLNRGFIESTKKEHLWINRPKHYTMLHEIYYSQNNTLPEAKVRKITDRLKTAVANFHSSKTFKEVQNKEQMQFVESETFRHLKTEEAKVYIVMDLVYKDLNNRKWIIVDWKTGKSSEEDRNQLALYALYLQHKHNIQALEDIIIRNEYLLDGTHVEHQLSEQDLINVQHLYQISMEQMKLYLEDTNQNQPLPLNQFPMQDDPRVCARCNYQELCFPS